jgi:hypothetical protein
VEAQCRGRVQIQIDVMYSVESPKKWNEVREYMPEVERIIHQYNSGENLKRSWQMQLFQQAESRRASGRTAALPEVAR